MRTLEEVSFAEDRIVAILRDISFRQREQMGAQDDLAASKNYTGAAAVQSRLIGLQMAETLIRDELKSLERIRLAVIATQS
jgi:hypothetical protein